MSQTERWIGRHRQVGEVALDDEDVRLVELAARTARRRHLALVAGHVIPIALGFLCGLAMAAGAEWKTPQPPLQRALFLVVCSFVCTLPFAAVTEAIDPVKYGRRGPSVALVVMLGSAIGVTLLWHAHPSRAAMAAASALVVSQLATWWIGFNSLVRRRTLANAARGLADRLRRDAAGRVAYEMELPGAGWNRTDESPPEEPPFEPVLVLADPRTTRQSMTVLPSSSVLFRVGDARVVERLRIVQVTEIEIAAPSEAEPESDGAPTRSLSPREITELRAHVARETRAFGWRSFFTAYWFLLVARLIDAHFASAEATTVGPRALLLATSGFGLYLWFRLPALRALRRDARDPRVVRVPLDPYRGDATAEVLRHSGRVWSTQGAPAPWRTAR